MLKYVQFIDPISGSQARLLSITASLFGTASYITTSSMAINAVGYWNSSSFTGSVSSPSVVGFGADGKPKIFSSDQNLARLVYRDGLIQWIFI